MILPIIYSYLPSKYCDEIDIMLKNMNCNTRTISIIPIKFIETNWEKIFNLQYNGWCTCRIIPESINLFVLQGVTTNRLNDRLAVDFKCDHGFNGGYVDIKIDAVVTLKFQGSDEKIFLI